MTIVIGSWAIPMVINILIALWWFYVGVNKADFFGYHFGLVVSGLFVMLGIIGVWLAYFFIFGNL